jgi:hypothetical protein
MKLPETIKASLLQKGWSEEEINSEAIRRGYEIDTPAQEKSMLGNLGEDIGQTIGSVAGSLKQRGERISEITPFSTPNPIRAAGGIIKEVAGGIGDVVGGALLGAGKVALPEEVESGIRDASSKVIQSEAVQSSIEGYKEWKVANPDKALALEAGVNTLDVLTLGAPGALKKAFFNTVRKVPFADTTKSVLKEGGQALERAATEQSGEAIARTVTQQGKKLPILAGQTAEEAALGTGKVSKASFGRLEAPLYSVPQIKSLVDDIRGVVKAGDENAAKNINALEKTIDALNRQRDNLPAKKPFQTANLRGMFDDISTDTVARFPEVPNVRAVVDDLVERFVRLYNTKDGMNLKYSRDLGGFHTALKDWKKTVVKEYGNDVFDPTKPAGSVRKMIIDRMRERGINHIADQTGGTPGEQYRALGKRLYSLEEADDMLRGKYKFDTNISAFQAIKKHATLATVMNVAGVASVFLGGLLGPSAVYTALGLLAAGNTIRVGKRMLTGPVFKESLGKAMQKSAELIGKTASPEERKLLKQEYISMATLLINFAELEADAQEKK